MTQGQHYFTLFSAFQVKACLKKFCLLILFLSGDNFHSTKVLICRWIYLSHRKNNQKQCSGRLLQTAEKANISTFLHTVFFVINAI